MFYIQAFLNLQIMELLEHKQVEALSAVIFTIVFAGHALRAVMGWSLQSGPYSVPMYVSWIAVLVAGLLAYSFWSKVLDEYEVI